MRKLSKIFRGKKRRDNQLDELEWMDFDDEIEEAEEGYYEDDEEYYEDDEVEEDEEYYEDDEIEEDGEYYEDDEVEEDEEYYEDDEVEEDEEYYEDDEVEEDNEVEEDDEVEEDEEYYEDDEIEEDEEYYEDDEVEEEEEYYEDDEIEDEDEYYEDEEEDEYYEEDQEERTGFAAFAYKITHLPATDYAVALTSVVVLALAVVTGVVFFGAKNVEKQVETFAEIGVGLEDIDMIGEQGLVAIADAQAAKLMAAEMVEEEEEEEEEGSKEDDGKKAQAVMHLSSIQKDLKIKFVNSKTEKLISNIAFEVEIEKPSGEVYTKKDDDQDGVIYQTDLAPGKYQVRIISPSSNEEYDISSEKATITVKDTIEYKKVDVADEVKTESQVNASVEDTKVNETVVESVNTDTVEWVESTKTVIEGTEKTEESYEKVDSKKVPDPAAKVAIGFRLLTEETNPTPEGGDPTEDPTGEPTQEPTKEPEPDPTEEPTENPTKEPDPTGEPTQEPTQAPEQTAMPTSVPSVTPSAEPSKPPVATVTPTVTPTAKPSVSPTPSAKPSATPTATPNNAKNDKKTTLKSTDGETLYVKENGEYRKAKYADYYIFKEFYRLKKTTTGEYRYTGWQVIDGVTYFFDKNGNKVTGDQVILGAKYSFNSDGSLNKSSGSFGIDVSKWNGNIDWNAVKNSGVSYVIIRCGYRGSTTGALIEDPKFRANIQGASKAGIKVGIYFFTQAVNEVEAVEEASMVLSLIKGYNITYPVFLDVESSGGRADGISVSTRTAVCKAFCQTIQNSGYKAGVYANKTWFNEKIETPSLTGYKIWLAQYAAAPSYSRTRYDIWQYSSKGSVPGISGSVDMNTSYMGY